MKYIFLNILVCIFNSWYYELHIFVYNITRENCNKVTILVCSGADQRKHQSSSSLAFVRGIHRGPVNSMLCFLYIPYFCRQCISPTYHSSMQEWIMQGLQHKLRCKKNTWHVESNDIVNRFRYINNVTKDRYSIPMNIIIVPTLHKYSL